MKLALIFFCVLAGLSWVAPQKPAPRCRGKVLPIQLLPGPKMTGPPLPLRFGGTREFPRYPINSFLSEKPFRLVIKTRPEFSDFWKQFTAPMSPNNGPPPPPPVGASVVAPNSVEFAFSIPHRMGSSRRELFLKRDGNRLGNGNAPIVGLYDLY